MNPVQSLIKISLRQILLLLTIFVFTKSILHWLPGDPIEMLVLEYPGNVSVSELKKELGLDQAIGPKILFDFVHYLKGDWGQSLISRQPVLPLIASPLWATLKLASLAMLFTLASSFSLGLVASLKHYPFEISKFWKKLSQSFYPVSELLGTLSPSLSMIWLGPILVYGFCIIVPVFSVKNSLFLPAFAITFQHLGFWARAIRNELVESYQHPRVQFAESRGLKPIQIIYRYAWLPNSKNLTVFFINQFSFLFTGAWITEIVFDRSGLGQVFIQSILSRDYPVTEAAILTATAILLLFQTFSQIRSLR